MYKRRKVRKIQTLITLFWQIFAWGTPDYTGSPLQVSQPSPNADLSLHSPNSLGSQSTKSYLPNLGLKNYLLTSVQYNLDEEKAFFLLRRSIELRPWMSKAKGLVCTELFCCESGALIARARYWRCLRKVESLLFDWKLRESFLVSHFRSVHGWYVVARKQSLRSHCTWARSGETGDNLKLRASEPKPLSWTVLKVSRSPFAKAISKLWVQSNSWV